LNHVFLVVGAGQFALSFQPQGDIPFDQIPDDVHTEAIEARFSPSWKGIQR
jgi:hypothetical protein